MFLEVGLNNVLDVTPKHSDKSKNKWDYMKQKVLQSKSYNQQNEKVTYGMEDNIENHLSNGLIYKICNYYIWIPNK